MKSEHLTVVFNTIFNMTSWQGSSGAIIKIWRDAVIVDK